MIRVIGLGSPFGDDRAGWWVVEYMRETAHNGIELLELDRPGTALVSWMDDIDHLVLVDAVQDGGPPGRHLRIQPDQLNSGVEVLTSHQLALGETLQLAEVLGCLPRKLSIYGVTIDPEKPAPTLVRTAARNLANELCTALEQRLRVPDGCSQL